MLLTGDLEQCWHLTTAASRTCTALTGAFFVKALSCEDSDDAQEARYCLCLCYMLDKSLCISMNRPPSLPNMNVNIHLLAPIEQGKPFTAMIHISLELAHIQEILGRETRADSKAGPRIQKVNMLLRMMRQVEKKMREARHLFTSSLKFEAEN